MGANRTRFFVFSLKLRHNNGAAGGAANELPKMSPRIQRPRWSRSPRAALFMALSGAAIDCQCPNRAAAPARDAATSAPQPSPEDPDFAEDDDAGADAALPPRCTLGPRVMLGASSDADAGVEAERYEAPVVRALGARTLAAMADSSSRQLVVVDSDRQRSVASIGPEPIQALSVVGAGEHALVFAVATQQRARWQRAFVRDGAALRLIAAQRGLVDDSLGITTCSLRDAALVAWDESPTEGRSIVRAQRWTATTQASPATLTLSAPEHDASDPVVTATPDGGAILAYLSLQEVAVETANQSAADIIVRAINADGSPRGAAVNLTARPKTRFGVTLHATASGRWIAWRLASDSDHEGLGDGGRVAIVALGPELRAVRSPDYLTDLDRVPAGRIAILSEGATADVYWTERRGDDVVTVRRSVGADGALIGEPREEPALDGQVPFGGDARRPRIAVWGRGGEPGFAIADCPR